MKFIGVLVLILSSQVSLARTGTKTFSYSMAADTEEALLFKAEQAIPQIQRGIIKSPFQYGECWPNNERTIKVKSLSIKKNYAVKAHNVLVPYYTGSLSYIHRKCRIDR